MARETIIPSVSVEVVKEVVPPPPAATGIVAILGSTEKGTPLIPTRIDRFPTLREVFGAGSVYSMPEAKHALQNGAKELVIVRLEDGQRAEATFNSVAGNEALKLTARAEGVWGNEIRVQVMDGKASGTHRIDLYYQSDEPVETFDNLSMQPAHERYLVKIINSQSELVTPEDLTGKLPAVMTTRRSLLDGTDGVKSSFTLTANTGAKNVAILQAVEFGSLGDNIQVTVGAGTTPDTFKITIVDTTDPSIPEEVYDDLVLDANAESIVDTLGASDLITAEVDTSYIIDLGDSLDSLTEESLTGGADRLPAMLTPPLQDSEGNDLISVTGRDPSDGTAGNGIFVRVIEGSTDDVVTLNVWDAGTAAGDPPNETYTDANIDPGSPDYIITRVNRDSTRIELAYLAGAETLATMASPEYLSDGANPDVDDFNAGLTALEREPDVDIVIPSIQYPPPPLPNTEFQYSQNVFAAVDAHCKKMSESANNRMGFGGVSRMEHLATTTQRTNTIGSDRFVIVAPHGVVGAVAGLVGSMTYYYSPTFKAITGFTTLERDFSPTDLRSLLRAYIVPLDAKKGLGIIIIRGLTTDGDQISVRRVADYAVRNVKNIAERFIGNLNTQDGRDALKQKVIEFLQQMEKDTAIVPSTDGTEPAFKVDVYSTQRDFALGIVRVDIAVRPVRAIDFIYATILVEV